MEQVTISGGKAANQLEQPLTRVVTVQESLPAAELFAASDKTFADCRQRLIAYLVKLNHALDQDLPDLAQALLQRFCESLVDYLSAGHFNVFQRVSLAADEYAAIEATTQLALCFNDRYGEALSIDSGEVKLSLEHLAQVLGSRFELEDDVLLADRCRRH